MIAVYLLAWRAGRAATGFGILAAPRAPSKSVADAWRSFSTAADSARPDGAASATEQEASAALDSIAKQRRILTDMRHPAQWYPAARALRRKIIAHLGPTNSGKTHAALQKLQAARDGVYCGPLRLLACEVYDRLNASSVACDLVTGQEMQRVSGSRHVSCTVEMAVVGDAGGHQTPYEVCVLDEIQMIADRARGWAWTRALLGLPTHELHVCGDPSVLPLLEQLVADCGDELKVHYYERLTPLVVSGEALGSVAGVRPGDALVAFSRRSVHSLQREVVRRAPWATPSLVYGALPPESRRHSAAVFNASNHPCDVLVASDAIGMGLNLAVQRVIFSSLTKFDGEKVRPLTSSEIKQIAGRAGRYRLPTTTTTTTQPHSQPTSASFDTQQQHDDEPSTYPDSNHKGSYEETNDDHAHTGRGARSRRRVTGWQRAGYGRHPTNGAEGSLQGGLGRHHRHRLATHSQHIHSDTDQHSAHHHHAQHHNSTSSDSSQESDSDTIDNGMQDGEREGGDSHVGERVCRGRRGVVTCLHASDLPALHAAMAEPPTPLRQAQLAPRSEDLAAYYDLLTRDQSDHGAFGVSPSQPLDQVLRQYNQEANLSPQYQLADQSQMLALATLLSGSLASQLSIKELLLFCQAPADPRNPTIAAALLRYIALFIQDGEVPIEASHVLGPGLTAAVAAVAAERRRAELDTEHTFTHTGVRSSPIRASISEDALSKLEEAHAVVDLYVWLGLRLPHAFRDIEEAQEVRGDLAAAITAALETLSHRHHRGHTYATQHQRGSRESGARAEHRHQ